MCIALISTAHPEYKLIVADNRDEYLHRPTARAHWWTEHPDILSARDLARPAHGTWLGVTKHGRIAVLTNFREKNANKAGSIVGRISRGEIVGRYLTMSRDQTDEDYAAALSSEDGPLVGSEAGGFTLVFGDVRGPLTVVSNRPSNYEKVDGGEPSQVSVTQRPESSQFIGSGGCETVALSNVAFGDRSWPKITLGEEKMTSAIKDSVASSGTEDDLIERLLGVLTCDTLPRLRDAQGMESYLGLLKESVFIPAIGDAGLCTGKENEQAVPPVKTTTAPCAHGATDAARNANAVLDAPSRTPSQLPRKTPSLPFCQGSYGTQTQTIVLVHRSGRVTYFERALYDEQANPIPVGQGDQVFRFEIED